MAEWKPQDMKEIFETRTWAEANRYLTNGWVLIDTYKTCYDPERLRSHQSFHYVLGWVETNAPFHPKQPYSRYKTSQ